MSEGKHTPGPWFAHQMQKNWVISAEGRLGGSSGALANSKVKWHVAKTSGGAPDDPPNINEANARLIAAAPDYDTAARNLVGEHDTDAQARNFKTCGCRVCAPFRAAIAKASGTEGGK